MLALHSSGYRCLLQVHDEIVISVPEKKDAVEASKLMVNAVELAVPSRVDVEVGPNWGAAK